MENTTLQQLANDIAELKTLFLQNKKVFSFDEACTYTGFSKSYMYKITPQLPFSKPNGKTLFIAKEDLDNWLLSNKSKSQEKREREAATYCTTHK
jgi:excisionase family DNA binding protein